MPPIFVYFHHTLFVLLCAPLHCSLNITSTHHLLYSQIIISILLFLSFFPPVAVRTSCFVSGPRKKNTLRLLESISFVQYVSEAIGSPIAGSGPVHEGLIEDCICVTVWLLRRAAISCNDALCACLRKIIIECSMGWRPGSLFQCFLALFVLDRF